MRIQKLSIFALFGIFDHEIPLNLRERITLVLGPNGFGKTTLLRLTNELFNGRFGELFIVPFRSAKIDFDSGQSLLIRKEPDGPDQTEQALDLRLVKGTLEVEATKIRQLTPRDVDIPLGIIDDVVPWITRTAEARWTVDDTGEELSLAEVLRRYGHMLPGRGKKQQVDAWLTELIKSVKVRFIESQRLVKLERRPRRPESRFSHEAASPAVVFYSGKLAEEIKTRLTEYAQLSQALDQTFPMRLVDYLETADERPVESSESIQARLSELDDKRKRLREAGLLEKETVPFQVPLSLHGPTQQVLPLYVTDVEKKLKVFDQILAKIELLKEIANSRFLFKSLSTTKDGFAFTTESGRPLSPVDLSSGEQHMLILLSELLFVVDRNSLILIDEPEISLHVAWQQEFLRDLKAVTELADVDVLIATHAPQIINDRWEFAVELQSPMERKA